MEFLSSIFSWFASDTLGTIIGAVTLIVTGATAIAALTPTPKDDEFLAKVRKVIDFLAGNVLNNK